MPRKATKAKKTRKRKQTQLRKIAPLGRSFGFPSNTVAQLRYSTQCQLVDAVGGVFDVHFFRANSIFAPDVTGTTHQPLGRDQWEKFYNHYRVKKATISAKLVTTSVGSGQPVVLGIYLADDTTIPQNWTTLVEAGKGNYVVHTPGNTESHHLYCKFDAAKFYKHQGINMTVLGAPMIDNPDEGAFFAIYAQSADQASTFVARSLLLTIDYLVEFSEPKDMEQS